MGRMFTGDAKITTALRLHLCRASWLDDFDFSCNLEKVLHIPQVATDNGPLVDKAILNLGVAGVQVQEL